MLARVLIAADHDMVRAGLCGILEASGRAIVVGEVSDGRSALRSARTLSPDVVVMEAGLPLLNGVEATRQMIAQSPNPSVIIVSDQCELGVVTEALRAGASGYLLQTSASVELLIAIEAVQRGEVYLSPRVSELLVAAYVRDQEQPLRRQSAELTQRQREVVQLLAEGKSNKEVAADHWETSPFHQGISPEPAQGQT